MFFLYLLFYVLDRSVHSSFVPKVVGGDFARIDKFPHAVFVYFTCDNDAWSCGASIINQKILLSASHCFDKCNPRLHKILAFIGNAEKRKGTMIPVADYFMHEKYDTRKIYNDIALLALTSSLSLNDDVKRVAIYPKHFHHDPAYIAGWGLQDEINNVGTMKLRFTRQNILNSWECQEKMGSIPAGTFCATGLANSYASNGDSGSALIVRNYIQIGLVSFKKMKRTRSIVVYTDTSNYYSWIKNRAKMLYCRNQK